VFASIDTLSVFSTNYSVNDSTEEQCTIDKVERQEFSREESNDTLQDSSNPFLFDYRPGYRKMIKFMKQWYF
jgi:hypothetical protein